MYIGEIIAIGNSYFVYLPSLPLKQKVYPISSSDAEKALGNGKIVECELIPNNEELDEQVEYTALIINNPKYAE
jgi:hypothetical protein